MPSSTFGTLPGGQTLRIPELHPAFYVHNRSWILFSNLTILFNKQVSAQTDKHKPNAPKLTYPPRRYLLTTANFAYPILLTTIHLTTATILTQLLGRLTPLLNTRHNARLTGRIYLRAILPIGLLYTLSLALSNLTYLYLSISFIQMLKAFAPVSTLFVSWTWGVSNPRLSVMYNVLVIALGVLLSSIGEVRFSWLGFGFQMAGTVVESMRLLLIQVLLEENGEGLRMNPLVGLYYYAPVCAVLNGLMALVMEVHRFQWVDLERVGCGVLLLNGLVAFMLNVSSVFLIGKTSALAMNLTGILKSILLVIVSVVIWHTSIGLLQGFGYSIALLGMLYYSMGPEAARANLESCKSWLRDNGNAEGVDSQLSSVKEWLGRQWESEPLSGLRSNPWGEYYIASMEEKRTIPTQNDIESGDSLDATTG